ncbi:RNA polymerase sigma factor [Luteimonas salinilitoris]|uniref:RNA polymerase sigma factor n=1 Tax=Luteimonas salinilitoris TaxID=3237697 RepID=A0ABV4HRY3_9GAMM
MSREPSPAIDPKQDIDDRAFQDFLRSQFGALVRFLQSRQVSEQDAQDMAQESLMRLTRYRGQPESALRTLSYRIALNLLCDSRRSRAGAGDPTHTSLDAGGYELPDDAVEPDQHAHHHQELARVRQAILRLPQHCRQIYLLNRIEGMSYSQISRHAGISVKAVEKQMSKALSLLRKELLASPGPETP